LPFIFPGEYSVEITTGEKMLAQEATIHPDPRFSIGREDYEAMFDFQVDVIAVSKKYSLGVTAVNRVQSELNKLDKAFKEDEEISSDVTTRVNEFKDAFQVLSDKIKPRGFGYKVPAKVALRGGYLSTQLMFLGMWAGGFPAAPTEVMLAAMEETKVEVDSLIGQLNEFIRTEIPGLNKFLESKDLTQIKAPMEIKF
jgi:hypothetical protein